MEDLDSTLRKGPFWSNLPPVCELNNHEVHLWIAELPRHMDRYGEYRGLLTEEEQQREAQFKTSILKKHFSLSRSLLRLLLRRYVHPIPVDFSYGKYGKPYLKYNPSCVQFNLSHSHNLTVYAITKDIPLGVDIEYITNDILTNELQEMIFSQDEKEKFCSLKKEQQNLAFFRAWTCKEAFLKATGVGLSRSLHDIEVAFSPSEQPGIVRIDGEVGQSKDWSVVVLDQNPGYLGALAVQTSAINLTIYEYL